MDTRRRFMMAPKGGSADVLLYQGYASANSINRLDIGINATQRQQRVRTDELIGSHCKVATKSGYKIAMVTYYKPSKAPLSNQVYAVTNAINIRGAIGATSYEFNIPEGHYFIVTFARTDETRTISPDEDIVKTFLITA